MKNNNNNTTNSGTGSGFFIGFILGVLATLLLTTKKGREILKELIDKGMQKIKDIEELQKKVKKEQEQEPENDYVKPKPPTTHSPIRKLFLRRQRK